MTDSASQPLDNAPLRVLHLASGDLWAGAEVQIYHLLRALQSTDGIEPYAVLMNDGILAERLRTAGILVQVIDEALYSTAGILRRLNATVGNWAPTIIHTHRQKEHILGSLVGLRHRCKLVATTHGLSEGNGRSMRQRVLSTLQAAVFRRAHDRIVAVSGELANHLKLPAHKITVIENGVDPEAIVSEARTEISQGEGRATYKLAFLGRMVPVKQIDRILQAVAILESESPGAFSLDILGEGPLESSLRTQAAELGLSDTVHFLGFLANPLPALARMDAVIFASKHEGLPMTALEALALGVPVVAPPIGGLTALLTQASLGVLADSSDGEALAKAIRIAVELKQAPSGPAPAVPIDYLVSTAAGKHLKLYLDITANRASTRDAR